MRTPSDDLPRRDAAFGAAVRARRAQMGITLEQLAQATGISRSALSRIERDELGTSLNYGLAIAQALGCDLAELVVQEAARITRAADVARYTDPASGVQRLALARPAPGMEWVAYTLPPGAQSSHFAPHPSGTREFFHIIAGQVQIHMAEESFTLSAGDTATLRADVPHGFRNIGDEQAHIMLLISTQRNA